MRHCYCLLLLLPFLPCEILSKCLLDGEAFVQPCQRRRRRWHVKRPLVDDHNIPTTTTTTTATTTSSPTTLIRTQPQVSGAAKKHLSICYLVSTRGGGGATTTTTTPPSPPPFGRWIGSALSSAFLMAVYSLCIKVSSATIHPFLGGFVLQFVATLLGGASLLVASMMQSSSSSSSSSISGNISSKTVLISSYDRQGLLWSVAAGLAVGAAELLSFHVSGMGVQASQSVPVMIGGSVAIGSVLGALLLQERMTVRGWVGVLLVVAGIACVATDPGAKMLGGHG